MLSWSEKLSLLTTKGLTWKEVQELDRGLDSEKDEKETESESKHETEVESNTSEEETTPVSSPVKEIEPTETEKKLLEKIESLETQLKEAQADNVHANNGGSQEPSFDEQLETMFKDFRI